MPHGRHIYSKAMAKATMCSYSQSDNALPHHNNLVSDEENGGLKEARDEDDNIIISDSTLFSLLAKKLKISSRYKVM